MLDRMLLQFRVPESSTQGATRYENPLSPFAGLGEYIVRAEVRRSFITTTVREESQVTPQVGFELETNGFQFYAIANLDKTSLV